MGMAKNQMMEEEERGFGSIDTRVCEHCVHDYALENYLIENGQMDTCDYCGSEAICIDTEELMQQIMEGIWFKYSRAVDELGYSDGEYVGVTYDSYDVLDDILCGVVADEVFSDISEIINDEVWCERDPYGLPLSKEQSYMWSGFCEMVKKHNRYVFFKTQVTHEKPNYMILDEIAQATEDFNLYRIVTPNSLFYRGRMHNSKTKYSNPKDLCSPPHQNAKPNRMSAEGISVFYGGNDADTAIAEIFTSAFSFATVVAFKNLKELVILDLTQISTISTPSIFDVKNRDLREPLFFLRELLADLTRPIESMHSIEYIPAQVIGEYFRYVHKHNGKQVDGIAYGSSKQKGGICYVLFAEHEKCLPQDKKHWGYDPTYQILEMDNSSLKTYKVDNQISLETF